MLNHGLGGQAGMGCSISERCVFSFTVAHTTVKVVEMHTWSSDWKHIIIIIIIIIIITPQST